jgi:hypothetical protein
MCPVVTDRTDGTPPPRNDGFSFAQTASDPAGNHTYLHYGQEASEMDLEGLLEF